MSGIKSLGRKYFLKLYRISKKFFIAAASLTVFMLFIISEKCVFGETLSGRRWQSWAENNSSRRDVASVLAMKISNENCTRILRLQRGCKHLNSRISRTFQKRDAYLGKGFKPKVLVFVGIMSAPRSVLRRNALRRSWLNQCSSNDIPCLFFTDNQNSTGGRLAPNVYIPLEQEQLLHGDMIRVESPGGLNFARRYLWILNWANARYEFEYFLRVDDDYFVCMDRLLLELPHRSRKKLYWGHLHCSPPGGVRIDEGFIIVSNDLAQRFLREQNRTLMCHPFGGQAIVMWINSIPGVTYFGDPRVRHSVASGDRTLNYKEDLCGKFLAIHGSYPVDIEKLWRNYLAKGKQEKYEIPSITYPCGKMNKTYDYTSFRGIYKAKPRPCRENPIWDTLKFWSGRSGH